MLKRVNNSLKIVMRIKIYRKVKGGRYSDVGLSRQWDYAPNLAGDHLSYWAMAEIRS